MIASNAIWPSLVATALALPSPIQKLWAWAWTTHLFPQLSRFLWLALKKTFRARLHFTLPKGDIPMNNYTTALLDAGKAAIQVVEDLASGKDAAAQEAAIVGCIEAVIPKIVADAGLPAIVGTVLALDPIVRLVYDESRSLLAKEAAALEHAVGLNPAPEAPAAENPPSAEPAA